MNVLVINGHPRNDSFSEALVNAYLDGATRAGVNVTNLKLADLSFNLNVTEASPRNQHFEEDILHAQELIAVSDHLVFVYPTWWGTMPAILKGFIDRVFTPGFAFEDIEGGTGYAPLLRGKSAHIITTMDSPKWVYHLIYRSPGHNAMRRATLQFCGINPITISSFSSVKSSSAIQRDQWITKIRNEGLKLREGNITPWNKFRIKAMGWMKALRLQFYPMTWIAYAMGAYAAKSMGYGFDRFVFWLGWLWLFLVEITTVLSNDYFDFKSDVKNKFFSPFTGGSRVIVEKHLNFNDIKKGIWISLALSFVVLLLLLFNIHGSLFIISITCLILFILALGYTVPPLRLSYRSLGEIDVAFTHSFAVIICGFIFQGGNIGHKLPWLLSVPLFFAVLPSIILSGIPDYAADKEAAKKTLAVRFGIKTAALLSIFFTILSAITAITFKELNVVHGAFGNLIYAVIPHAVLLIVLICRYLKTVYPKPRIDTIMIASLTYLIWFALIPLIKLS